MEHMKEDILTVVGGDFSPDSIGPDKHAVTVSRIRSRAADYLDVFESLFLGVNFDAIAQAELYLPAFLKMVADIEPERVRNIAKQLAHQMDSVLVIHDAVKDKPALLAALPQETASLARRLEQRRIQLKNLMK